MKYRLKHINKTHIYKKNKVKRGTCVKQKSK